MLPKEVLNANGEHTNMDQSAPAPRQSERRTSAVETPKAAFLGLDRFTISVVLLGLGLVVVALLAVRGRPSEGVPADESQPAGVVNNYYLALLNDDPKKAYD